MTIPNFGDRIKIAAWLHRERSGNKRMWQRIEYDEPKEAVFIIKRTLQNGTVETEYNGDEGSAYYFSGDEYLPGAIVGIKGVGVGKVLLSDITFVCQTCGK